MLGSATGPQGGRQASAGNPLRPDPAPSPTAGARTVSAVIEKLYSLAASAEEPVEFGQMLLIGDAGRADAVLRDPALFQKQYTVARLLGTSRFDSDGEGWEKRRSLTQPAYLKASRSSSRPEIAAAFEARLDAVAEPGPDAVRDALLSASAEIFHRAFGLEAPGDAAVALFEGARPLLRKMQHVALFGTNATDLGRLRTEAGRVRESFASWGGETQPFRRFADSALTATDEIPDFDPLGEYLMNFFAGTETTAATMGWALDRLGTIGELQERIHREVASGAGSSPLLEAFVNEVLRYFPPIPFLVRRATEAAVLGGISVRKEQTLIVSLIGLHHDPRYWESPRRFDPERREFTGKSYNRRAFLPFSMGARVCGGASLARMEAVEGLAAVIRGFRVTRAPGPTRFDFALALRPESSNLLTLETR